MGTADHTAAIKGLSGRCFIHLNEDQIKVPSKGKAQ